MAKAKFRDGVKCYGWNACGAIFRKRPQALIRAYIGPKRVKACKELLRYCVEQRLAYHLVGEEELDTIAGTQHHEGICLVVVPPAYPKAQEAVKLLKARGRQLLIYAPGVRNPHNIGAMLRSAAHFGTTAFALDAEVLPLSGASQRVAEGGAEGLAIWSVEDATLFLRQLKSTGFKIVATSSHAKLSAASYEWPERTLLLFGAEGEGLAPELTKAAQVKLTIPGSGAVESLNVSAATAVLLAYWYREAP